MSKKKNKLLIGLYFLMFCASVFGQQNQDKQDGNKEMYSKNPYYNPNVQPYRKDQVETKAREVWNDNNFPFNPNDINKYMDKAGELESTFKPNLKTKLIKKSFSLDQSNPQSFPEIITAIGFSSIVTFWDSSGNPWDIEYVANGNARQFQIFQPEGSKNKNIIIINPLGSFSRTNLTVSLRNESQPILLQIATNDVSKTDVAYGETSIQLRKINPVVNVDAPFVDNSFKNSSNESNVLLKFLDDLPPKGSIRLKTKNINGDKLDVWLYDDNIYIRSFGNLIWPPIKAMQKNASRMSIYKTTKTPLIKITDEKTGRSQSFEVNLNVD